LRTKDNNLYRYELHCHTAEGSVCSNISAVDLVTFYHKLGYSGICVTDHFSGNGSSPNEMPWSQRVKHFHDIYLKTYEAGKKLALNVFFGIEYSITPDIKMMSKVTGNDFLFLNISMEWLIDNKEMFRSKPSEIFKSVRAAGGFIIHAHPYSEASYIECIRLYPRAVDAVEVYNPHDSDIANKNSLAYARAYGLIEVAGSDFHGSNQQVFTGVETDSPCFTSNELVDAIKNGQARIFKIDQV
jgi:hypothetical protein